MIQRIQTIFLLLAIGCIAAMFALPVTSQVKDGVEVTRTAADGTVSLIFWSGIGAVLLISIFLYKNRKLQITMMKVVYGIYVLMLIGTIIHYFTADHEEGKHVKIWGALPLVILLLVILAHRFIRKDEELVKSLDRLR